MTGPRTAAFLTLLLVGLASACSQGSADEPELAPSPTPTATASPTPEATPGTEPTEEPTPDDNPLTRNEPPELHLIGDGYERLVRSHMTFRTWLFRHPDPELFDRITHPDCECYIQKNLLAHYAEQGLRWTGGPQGIVVREVRIVDDIARNHVHLQAVLERPDGGELVDEEGNVHDRTEPRAPWVEDLIFVREDEQSPWLLRDFLDRGPVEEGPDA